MTEEAIRHINECNKKNPYVAAAFGKCGQTPGPWKATSLFLIPSWTGLRKTKCSSYSTPLAESIWNKDFGHSLQNLFNLIIPYLNNSHSFYTPDKLIHFVSLNWNNVLVGNFQYTRVLELFNSCLSRENFYHVGLALANQKKFVSLNTNSSSSAADVMCRRSAASTTGLWSRGDELQATRRHRPHVVPGVLVFFSVEIPTTLAVPWYRPLLLTLHHIARRHLAAIQQRRLHRCVNRSPSKAVQGLPTICLCAACSRSRILLGDSCNSFGSGRLLLADYVSSGSLTRLWILSLSVVGVPSLARVERLSRHEQQRALRLLASSSLSC